MQQDSMRLPRIVIAALRGGSGKTILSIGIIAAWKDLGKKIAPFKKGPDYIDAGWLALSAGRPCYNLDTFLVKEETVKHSFLSHGLKADVAVVEGNRGLYDGIDINGTTSTAEIAKLLKTPVILCIDCTKSTRTMAAAVLGCIHFDPDVDIKGVILNRIAGSRHERILRKNIEHHCGIPVLGAVPKLKKQAFPERHMGLVPTPEHEWAKDSIHAAAQIAKQYVDLEALARVADKASENVFIDTTDHPTNPIRIEERQKIKDADQKPRIGIIMDSAFQFYYPDNIEALASAGAELVFVSPLKDQSLEHIDALYIGGGFPETHADKLAANVKFREELKSLVEGGFPVYAECGGLMYLGEKLVLNEKSYPMTGVLPIVFGFSQKPQGHGYTIAVIQEDNPYFNIGTEIRGHEFHYSKVLEWSGNDKDMVFGMKRGAGCIKNNGQNRDGIRYKNVLASYTHIHALGTPSWAEAMVRNAIAYKKQKKQGKPF